MRVEGARTPHPQVNFFFLFLPFSFFFFLFLSFSFFFYAKSRFSAVNVPPQMRSERHSFSFFLLNFLFLSFKFSMRNRGGGALAPPPHPLPRSAFQQRTPLFFSFFLRSFFVLSFFSSLFCNVLASAVYFSWRCVVLAGDV